MRLCAAPLVEGTLAATVSAASGAGIDKVIADAMSALEAKRVQLGLPSPTSDAAPAPMLADDGDTKSVSVIINNHNGLHVRPASKLVAALAGFNAESAAGEKREVRQTGQPQPNRAIAGPPQR